MGCQAVLIALRVGYEQQHRREFLLSLIAAKANAVLLKEFAVAKKLLCACLPR